MPLQTALAVIFAILASICIVTGIILFGWFLIWKTFLSKFRLVQELLGHTEPHEDNAKGVNGTLKSHIKKRKLRKD